MKAAIYYEIWPRVASALMSIVWSVLCTFVALKASTQWLTTPVSPAPEDTSTFLTVPVAIESLTTGYSV